MAQYHITPEGPKRCAVDPTNPNSTGCKYGDHYSNLRESEEAFTEILEKSEGTISTVESEPVRYSFLKNWEEEQERFKRDFEGFPNRFFKTDIRGREAFLLGQAETLGEYPGKVLARMAMVASAPIDLGTKDKKVEELAKKLEVENFEKLDDTAILNSLWAERAWRGEIDGDTIIFIDAAQPSRNMRTGYRLKGRNAKYGEFSIVNLRGLAAAARIERKTGHNILKMVPSIPKPQYRVMKDGKPTYLFGDEAREVKEKHLEKTREKGKAIQTIVKDLEETQREGANFKAQERYVREHSGRKLATAWQDKLHPSKTHQELAATTTLLEDFSKVEVDNAVTVEDFKQFEEHWVEAREKLPPIPEGVKPTIRVRFLGKHNANGIYFPHVNTVAIDVRTSEATIHEMGHYYDLALKNNASLSKDFGTVVKKYSDSIRIPDSSPKGKEYYGVPTEVFARAFELYAVEKLGVGGRLVKPREEYEENFDYKPFSDNPTLKEEAFSVFDKLFG